MVKDITGTINALRCAAVGRCRERLDQAARKAKGLLGNDQSSQDMGDKTPPNKEDYGVTSLLKRKHGL
jgi:hypothetical protein